MAKPHTRQNHILLFSIIFKSLEVIKNWIEWVGGESVSVLKFGRQKTAVSVKVSGGNSAENIKVSATAAKSLLLIAESCLSVGRKPKLVILHFANDTGLADFKIRCHLAG